MDADGARELGEPHQLLFHLDRRGHHHVGQLVEHHDPVGQRVVGADLLVIGGDVARAGLFQQPVAPIHLRDDDTEHAHDLVRFGNDVRHREVRNGGVAGQFDALGVDQNETQLQRRLVHQQRGDDRVDADALAGAGRAGDQHVRHFGEVGDHGAAAHIAAQGDGQAAAFERLAVFVGLQQAAQRDDAGLGVGHLDADHGASGHGRFDADRGG